MTRRGFFRALKDATLVLEGAAWGLTLTDRLRTREGPRVRLVKISEEDRDTVSGMQIHRKCVFDNDGEEVSITFFGALHLDKYGFEHGRFIREQVERENPTILCSEANVGDGSLDHLDYFGKVSGNVVFKIPVVGMEGYRANKIDTIASVVSDALFLSAWGALQARRSGDERDASLIKNQGIAVGLNMVGHYVGPGMNMNLAPMVSNLAILPGTDFLAPTHMQRNRFYCWVLRKLIEEGHTNIMVLTGVFHTNQIIDRLQTDHAVPDSGAFVKYYTITRVNEGTEEVSLT